MNGYERVKATMQGKKVDHLPVMLHNFQMCIKEAGINFDTFRNDPKKGAESFIRNAEKYDLDGVVIDVDTSTLAGAAGCKVAYEPNRVAATIGGILDDIGDAGNLKKIHIEDSRMVNNWLEMSRIISEYFKNEKYVRCNCDQAPFSLASMLRGSQELMMDLVDEDNDEDIFALLDYAEDLSEQMIRLAVQTGAACVSNGDSVAGPAMISPTMYRKFARAGEEKLANVAHEYGVDYMIHICGNATVILEDMKKVPVDAFELDYKTDLQKMHDVFHDCKVISGTIDPSDVISRGSVQKVRDEVNRLLDIYTDSTRLIVCSGCAVGPDAPEENVREFIKTVRER